MFVFTCLCDVLYGMSENYMLDCFRTRVPEEDKGDYILRQESEQDSGIDLHQICHRDLVIRNCMIRCLSCVKPFSFDACLSQDDDYSLLSFVNSTFNEPWSRQVTCQSI